MDFSQLYTFILQNTLISISALIIISLLAYLVARNIISRGLIYLASHTKTKVDDILIKHMRLNRLSLLAPMLVIYALAYLLPEYIEIIRNLCLFVILWLLVFLVISMLSAFNEIYESRPGFTGVSIQSYLDLIKLLFIVVGIILSLSLFTGESPLVLLTGLGALTAVLLLIFQDTILSVVASIQIVTQNLIKEGDWIEVPSYGADGDVVNISLHSIKIQNFDKTITVIPTHKIMNAAYKNWRGMTESGGRRIERSIRIDMTSIKFCDNHFLKQLRRIDLIQDYLDQRIQSIAEYRNKNILEYDSPLDGPQITNIEVFRSYIIAYLKKRPDIHLYGMPFLVRALEPTQAGLPIEVYIFTKTTSWEEYEAIQSEIFDHLLAAASHFDLKVFQEPTGMDFASFSRNLTR